MRDRPHWFIRLLKWPALAALALYVVTEILTDRFAVLQWLWWVPRPFIAGFALLWLLAPLVVCRRGEHRRREFRIAGAAFLLSAACLLHGTLELWGLPRDRPRDGVRLVHWNASYPEANEVAEWAVGAVLGLDADVIVITDPGQFLARDRALRFAVAGYDIAVPGRFAVLTRRRLVEATPLAASKRGSASRIVVETADGPLAIRAIDLPSDPRLSRRATAGELAATIASIDASTPDVIVGDFNITGGSDSLRQFGDGYRDSFHEAGTGWGGTYPRETPLWRIDLTLVRAPWRTLRAEIMDLHGKRHRAQVVDIHRDR
jgi:hypothetical protein